MSYQFLGLCNGYSTDAEDYSIECVKIFEDRYAQLKDHAKQLLGCRNDVWFSDRFHSPGTVLGRIRSVAYEHEFLNTPDEWILDGMRDCALADHWYMFEKDYGE